MPDVTIKATKNGPYLIRGSASVVDHKGKAFDTSEMPVVALCRCGQSANKPFCDGTHSNCGFSSDELAS